MFQALYGPKWSAQFDVSGDMREVLLKSINAAWYFILKDFEPAVVMEAQLKAMQHPDHVNFPPTPGQLLPFLKMVAKREAEKKARFSDHRHLLDGARVTPKTPRGAPSPLLGEYMTKHPAKENDVFEKIFKETVGNNEERGTRTMQAIREQLGRANHGKGKV